MKKGYLRKFIDRKFVGSSIAMANDMVVTFCIKHEIPGSAYGYDLYERVQEAIETALKDEIEAMKNWE